MTSTGDERPGGPGDWAHAAGGLGAYIREQRKLSRLTLRELAELAQVSNPYLSQLERGMHEPSVRVIRSIARALNLSATTLLEESGLFDEEVGTDRTVDVEAALRADPGLSPEQKDALISVYRTYLRANEH
jgi:transcriptional regulator with XRE-family HTH domain